MGAIVGDQITRILAENKGLVKKMTISNNIQIKDIKRKDFVVGDDKRDGLALDFTHYTKYDDTGTRIEVDITVFYLGEKKEMEEIEKLWKDKKVVSEKLVLPVNNRVLETGMLQAIALADQLKLPMPIKLPRFIAAEAPKEAAKPVKAS